MRFYILQHSDNEFQIIGTRQSLPLLPKMADVLASKRDLDWTVEDERSAITAVTALDAGYNLHKKISETASSGYRTIAITK